jgi:hypothetical protein
VLNKLKKQALAAGLGLAIVLPTIATVTGVAPVKIGAIESQKPASAGFVSTAIEQFGPQNLYYYLNAGRFRQEYYGNISPQEVQSVRNQYGAGADGVLHARCTERAISSYRLGWWEQSMLWGGYRFFFIASRVEGGGYNNCYARIAR